MSVPGSAARPSPAEPGQPYRAALAPAERSRLRTVRLLGRGRSEREAARVTGYGRRWVGEVARRYDEGGRRGLGDRRRDVGAGSFPGAGDEAALRVAPAGPPADGAVERTPRKAKSACARRQAGGGRTPCGTLSSVERPPPKPAR